MRQGADRFNCAVITMSDKGAVGQRKDTSGEMLQALLQDEGYSLAFYEIVPDVVDKIVDILIDCADNKSIDLIVTTGGTGVAPTDVTPEAMLKVVDKFVPGMAEAMRAKSFEKTPHALISRGMVGIRKESLIINLPGSKKAAYENIEVVLPALPHALEKIKGESGDCGG